MRSHLSSRKDLAISRAITAIIVVILVVAAGTGAYFVGQSAGPQVTQTAPAQTIVQTQTVTETAAPPTTPVSTERPTIRIISFNEGFMWTDLFDTRENNFAPLPPLQEFMDRENINVEVEFADEAVVRQKLQLDFTAHTGQFDITLADSANLVPSYGGAGFLLPLDDFIRNQPTRYLDVDDIIPKTLEGLRIEGKLYALPHFSFAATLNYRSDLFEKYGVEVPTTVVELEEALAKLQAGIDADGLTGELFPITMRGEPRETTALDVNAFTYQTGGRWFEGGAATESAIRATQAKPTFNSPEFLEGFKRYTDFLIKYSTPDTPSYDFSSQINLYASGKAVILFPQSVNAFAAQAFFADEEIGKAMSYAPTVVGANGRPIQQIWNMAFGINSDSKNPEAAWKVLTLLTGASTQKFFSLNVFPFPSLESVYADQEVRTKWGGATLDLVKQALLDSDPDFIPHIRETNIINVAIGKEASAVIAGLKTAEEAVEDLQEFVNTVMFAAGYYD